jgi:hypothetical protein
MLDLYTFDEEQFDGAAAIAPSPPTDAVYIQRADGTYFGLVNDSVFLENLVVQPPSMQLVERGFPRADGEYAESAYMRKTVASMNGWAVASSEAAMKSLLDQLKRAIGSRGCSLVYLEGDEQRSLDDCYATDLEAAFSSRQGFHTVWLPWSVSLTSTKASSRSLTRQQLSPATTLTEETTYQVVNLGTAVSQAVWTLNVSLPSGSLTSLTVSNVNTGEEMTIDRTFADGSSIVIDGENCEVTVDGVRVAWSGVIPRVDPGVNSFTMTPVGSGYSMTVYEANYDRYL